MEQEAVPPGRRAASIIPNDQAPPLQLELCSVAHRVSFQTGFHHQGSFTPSKETPFLLRSRMQQEASPKETANLSCHLLPDQTGLLRILRHQNENRDKSRGIQSEILW